MGNDVVELLDVAIGCINGFRAMILHKVFDQYDTIVEVGDMFFLTSKGAYGAIGKDVVMKIAIEIARKILAGEGKYDLILELGID